MKFSSLYKGRSLFARQWTALAALLLISGSLLVFDAHRVHDAALAAETHRALAATRVVQLGLEDSLERADNVMLVLRQEIQNTGQGAAFNLRLQTLAEAMLMIRSINVHDASGTIVATSRPEILGMNQNFMARDYFKRPQFGKTQTLYITPPFLSATGAYTVVLSRKLTDKSGAFSGVIAMSLDPTRFLPLLDSVRYADDMVLTLQHSEGVIFGISPLALEKLIGKNLAVPGSLFLKMRDSGLASAVVQGRQKATGEMRLTTQNEIKPRGRDVDQYLAASVSRMVDDVLAPSRHESGVKAAIWTAFSVVLLLSLWLHQRHASRLALGEKKALELAIKNERFLRTITDNIPGLVGYWKADLTCGFANAAYQDFFGKSPEQVEGMSLRELLGDALFAKNEHMISAALSGSTQRFERTLTKSDGSLAFTWLSTCLMCRTRR